MVFIDEKCGRVAWHGLIMYEGEQLMHKLGRISWFKSREQKNVEEWLK